jgi:hypothetical protein
MIIEIKKPITRMKVEKALSKIKKEKGTPKKTIAKHFGKLKRGIDGLTYQKNARNEWD